MGASLEDTIGDQDLCPDQGHKQEKSDNSSPSVTGSLEVGECEEMEGDTTLLDAIASYVDNTNSGEDVRNSLPEKPQDKIGAEKHQDKIGDHIGAEKLQGKTGTENTQEGTSAAERSVKPTKQRLRGVIKPPIRYM